MSDSALITRLQGQFVQADLLFAWDYAHYESGSPRRAEILFNWAETRRRVSELIRPNRIHEARIMLDEAFKILKPLQDQYPRVYAACLHHLGRLERQVGDYTTALALIEQSVWRIRVCSKELGVQYIDTLTTLLDAASIRAICGFPWRARLAAAQALLSSFSGMMGGEAESAHRKRALVLYLFATEPQSQHDFVRRAFFGREEKSES